uniref:Uncharacterized protein n=1 Tax=Amphimedon queenslandica TaxID=400682 RepID=A0A1X7UR64_AMPQE
MLDGLARKLALPFVLLSAIGWVTFAVGFGILNFRLQDTTDSPATGIEYFPEWCFGVASLLLYAVTITHLFCGNPLTIFLIMFFQSFFFASGGAIMFTYGYFIRIRWEADQEETLHKDEYEIIVMFVGAGIALLLYWTSLMFWPCFRRKEDYEDA